MKYKTLFAGALTILLGLASCGGNNEAKQESQMNVDESGLLLRGESTPALDAAFDQYLSAIQKDSMDIHSIMILQHGKVLKEKWMSEGAPEKAHILNSVSKTFTSTAVGFAISEGLLKLDDKLIDVLSEYAPGKLEESNGERPAHHELRTGNRPTLHPEPPRHYPKLGTKLHGAAIPA